MKATTGKEKAPGVHFDNYGFLNLTEEFVFCKGTSAMTLSKKHILISISLTRWHKNEQGCKIDVFTSRKEVSNDKKKCCHRL